jgi:GNAT superfamily N-acetyltransferase
MPDTNVLIVALDHPSLIDVVDQFAEDLRSEQRFFGRRATTAPFPSLINRLTSADGLRLGAQVDGRLVAMSRVDHRGDTSIAVVADARGQGIGRALLTATLQRAGQHGLGRLVLRSSQRSQSVAALGAAVGAMTVDQGCGRVDFILPTRLTLVSA